MKLEDLWLHEYLTAAATPSTCRCSHHADFHFIDRRGKTVCGSAACGCAELRLKEHK